MHVNISKSKANKYRRYARELYIDSIITKARWTAIKRTIAHEAEKRER